METCISLSFRLKQEVGSYALKGDSGFENLDFLQCCKFAEGDSRILMQKLARDGVKSYVRALKKKKPVVSEGRENEVELLKKLAGKSRNIMEWVQAYEEVTILSYRSTTIYIYIITI